MDASPVIADRFLDAVYEAAARVSAFPQTGTVCMTRSAKLQELRRIPITTPFGRWLMVYRIRESRVLILRVLHGSQDWQRIFE
jgi:plasmid stabilization system protein ParE